MTVYDSFTVWIDTFLACFGGCLGCDTKGAYPTKEEQIAERYSLSEDFWGTSSGFLDVPIDFSKRSNSILSISNLNFHSDIGSANTNSRGDFINHASGVKTVFSGLELQALRMNVIKCRNLQTVEVLLSATAFCVPRISSATSLSRKW